MPKNIYTHCHPLFRMGPRWAAQSISRSWRPRQRGWRRPGSPLPLQLQQPQQQLLPQQQLPPRPQLKWASFPRYQRRRLSSIYWAPSSRTTTSPRHRWTASRGSWPVSSRRRSGSRRRSRRCGTSWRPAAAWTPRQTRRRPRTCWPWPTVCPSTSSSASRHNLQLYYMDKSLSHWNKEYKLVTQRRLKDLVQI